MKRGYAAALTAVVVTALVAFGVWQVRPPAAAGPAAPAAAFSAARAAAHLTAIAAEPRPYGSAAHARVRDLLVRRLEEAGLEAWVQRAAVVPGHDRHIIARVENVVGRLPGRRGDGEVVLLLAHYDSVAASPGAADNATSVATLLEVARALGHGPPLDRDVLVLFTDGEEHGLLGAQAFLQSEWARRVGLVLNFDNPGSSGPSIMYETSPGSAPLVRAFAAHAVAPFASSLTDDIARRRWIESDFTLFRNAGLPGMTFGFTEGFFRNHSMLDTVAHVDPGSLQHQGEYALGLTRVFAAGEPRQSRDGETVYFNPVGGRLVVYPRSLALPLALAAALLYVAVAALGLWRRQVSPSGLLAGAVNSLLSLVFMGVLTALVWALVRQAYGVESSALPYYNDDLHRAGLIALVVAIGLAVYLWGLDGDRPLDTALAALSWWAVLGVFIAVALPGASYLLTWPLLAALVALGAVFVLGPLVRDDGRVAPLPLAVVLSGVAPGLLLVASSLYLLFAARGVHLVVIVVAVWLVLGLLVPHIGLVCSTRRWPLPAALGVAGAVLFIGLSPATGYGRDWPQPSSLVFREDASARRAWWGTVDEAADAWTGRMLGPPGRWEAAHEHVPLWGFTHYGRVPAAPLGLEGPRLEVLEDHARGRRRELLLLLRSPRRAPFVSLLLENEAGEVVAEVDGTAVAGGDTTFLDYSAEHWHVDVLGMPARGVAVSLKLDAGVRLDLRVVDLSYGLPPPAAALAGPRPDGFVPGGKGDAALTSRSYTLGARPGSPLREEAG